MKRSHREQGACDHWRGFTLVELMLALTLLTAVGAALVPLSQQLGRQRLALHQETIALEHVSNLLDQLTATSSSTPETLAVGPLSTVPGELNNAQILWQLTPGEGDDPLQRVTCTLSWQGPFSQQRSSVSLSAWQRNAGGASL